MFLVKMLRQIQNRLLVGRRKHRFGGFGHGQPAVAGVFRAQLHGRVTGNAGGENVFGIVGDAARIAVAPVQIDFVAVALLPVVQLAV